MSHLTLTFDVAMPVSQYPPGTITLPTTIGETASSTVYFRRDDGQPLEIALAGASPLAGLSATFERIETADPGTPGVPGGTRAGDVKATLTFGPSEAATQQNVSLPLRTNHPQRSSIALPVWIRVAAPLEAYPPTLSMLIRGGSATASGRVDLRASGAQQFEVTGISVEGDLGGAIARSLNSGAAGVHPIEVTLAAPQLAPGLHQGRLVVTTSHPRVPRVEVPVRLQVTPPPATPPQGVPAAAPTGS